MWDVLCGMCDVKDVGCVMCYVGCGMCDVKVVIPDVWCGIGE